MSVSNSATPSEAIFDVLRRQAGVITTSQAKGLGLTQRQIEYRSSKGEWINIQRGLYRHALFEESERMKIWALILAGNGHVSHWHAARLHGLDPTFGKTKPEVTVRQGTHVGFEGIRVHESRQLATRSLTTIDGLPVSGVERTIMDVAAVEPAQWVILALIDSAKQKGLTSNQALERCLAVHARRGRDGTVRFRGALSHPSIHQTPAIGHQSRKAARVLQSAGLPYPFFEEQVLDADGTLIAQVDLSYVVPLLGFLDGFTYHGARRAQTNRDRAQRQTLRNQGFVVMEFTADQNRTRSGYMMEAGRKAYAEAERRLMLEPERYRFWTERTLVTDLRHAS